MWLIRKNKKYILIGVTVILLLAIGTWYYRYSATDSSVVEPLTVTPRQVRTVDSVQAVDDLNDIVYIPSKKTHYISSLDESKIYAINAKEGSLVSEIEVAMPNRMLLSADEGWLYATDASNHLQKISSETFEMNDSVALGKRPTEIAIDQTNKQLFVVNELSDTLSAIDVENFEVIKTIPVGNKPVDVVVDRNNELVFVSNEQGSSITVIDRASLSQIAEIQDVGRPYHMLAFPDEDLVLVLDRYYHQLVVIDTNTFEVLKKIDVVDFPTDLVLNNDHTKLYIISFTANAIGVVDLAKEQMTEVIPLGTSFEQISGLNTIMLTPDEKTVIVTNTNTGQIIFVGL